MRCAAGCGELMAEEHSRCPECGSPLSLFLGECEDCGDETESPMHSMCDFCLRYWENVDQRIDARSE